ncbi:MAG: signal recognition particle-docking protein FtsY [Oscillospiraceae bacterium]|nr:signal recognition particle-docking protein FtsY [Candidatus Equicaccousia limihippi]
MGFFSKISEGLKKTRDALSNSVQDVVASFRKIDEDFFEELLETLISCDIGAATAEDICDRLKDKVKHQNVQDPEQITELLRESIADMLEGESALKLDTKPTVLLVIGVNGAGKTTTIGKLAHNLKSEGKKVVLGAADTFRAAAIDQLKVWADRAGVDIISAPEGSDPASVVFDTLKAGVARGADVIICDTAGRLHNKKNLMDELAKIHRVIDRELPGASKEVLLVLDGTTGQNAVNQAREFGAVTPVTGIIVTKLDGTAKGGAVLSVKSELDMPVKYIGVGEGIDDLQPFDAHEFARGLF